VRRSALVGVALVLFCGIGRADAQICTGTASFDRLPYQVGFGVGFSSSTSGLSGSVGAGNQAVFGIGAMQVEKLENVDGHAYTVSGTIGSDQPIDRDHNLYACPIASVGYTSGPTLRGVDTSAVDAALGGSIGIKGSTTGNLSIVPTMGLFYRHERLTAGSGPVNANASTSFGTVNFGIGLGFSTQLWLVPNLVVPFHADGRETSFSVALTYSFGR